MRIINSPDLIDTYDNTVAIGDFDGLHRGHMALMAQLSGNKVVLTFDKHSNYIYSKAYKQRLFDEIGIDTLLEQDFTRDFMNTSPVDFFGEYLVKRLRVKKVVVGYNFRFGHMHSGDTKLLEELCSAAGVELCVVPPVYVCDRVISSTLIREYITNGNIEMAQKMLGRQLTMFETVIAGRQLGREIGFPTINMPIDEKQVLPPDGVYLVSTIIDGHAYYGISNLGNRPTVSGSSRRLETHIIDYNGDLYGMKLPINILQKIRNTIKFDSVEQLKNQLHQDIVTATRLITNTNTI